MSKEDMLTKLYWHIIGLLEDELNMENIKWKSIELIELRNDAKEDYFGFLYSCYNDCETKHLVDNAINIKTERELIKDFQKKLIYKYHRFMIIKNMNLGMPIGYIYSYKYSPNDGTLYTTMYLNKESRNKIYGVEAAILFYEYLFNKYSIRKIYCCAYSYNKASISLLKNAGFKPEGNLKKSKFYDGIYYDTYIFALYKNDFIKIKNKLKNEQC